MSTDDDKNKLDKLLKSLEVPEVRLSAQSLDIIKKFETETEDEEKLDMEDLLTENPFIAPKDELKEIERKIKDLLTRNKRAPKKETKEISKVTSETDPKRPWRTNSIKEKLLRINNELKSHEEKGVTWVNPLEADAMNELLKECEEEGRAAEVVSADKLKDAVDCAKKNLPNFLYKKVNNSTATALLPEAHDDHNDESAPPKLEPLLPAVPNT